jgi:hypothetical protein
MGATPSVCRGANQKCATLGDVCARPLCPARSASAAAVSAAPRVAKRGSAHPVAGVEFLGLASAPRTSAKPVETVNRTAEAEWERGRTFRQAIRCSLSHPEHDPTGENRKMRRLLKSFYKTHLQMGRAEFITEQTPCFGDVHAGINRATGGPYRKLHRNIAVTSGITPISA